ncbi:hypothetical protein Mmc1_3275 [Magnetococcus marinus MC-1]|uniref:Uncharacterized protein n=1 Tax=Magnetococcus marinus (strain ATCC BAA-1437 / JCM 17883 / MC-1) TaxID=156889 RepID=A0LCS2_MAGMM|nr:hypothetical protein [Magnetococcus marinus]ABK45765.1 hypothetical protein Mmc1_3275 [Magnetococcus marinus MC-1]
MQSMDTPLRSGPQSNADLPELSLKDAAWLAGITPDAMLRFLAAAGLELDTDQDASELQLTVPQLMRAVFLLLGQKDNRIAMLRMQLAAALNREKELAAALQADLADDTPILESSEPMVLMQPLGDDDDDDEDDDDFIPKKKKKKKKKKKAVGYPW